MKRPSRQFARGEGDENPLLAPGPSIHHREVRVTTASIPHSAPLHNQQVDIVAQWRTLLPGMNPRTVSPSVTFSRPVHLTNNNARTNTHWGDQLTAKDPAHTRVYVVNLNGLTLDRMGGQFDTLCKILKETQVDIFCGQEHNLDTTQAPVRSILFSAADQHWERNRLVLGTTPITFHSTYKPGGTMAVTVGSLTSRISKQVRDKWGRWVCQEFQGRAGHQVVVVSAYQPLEQKNSAGKITIVAQQQSLLIHENQHNTNPRSVFRSDLLACLRAYHEQEVAILLVGDFNEPLGNDPAGMSKLAGELGLVDIMTYRHSSPPPATYARGSKRLDYALASPCLVEALSKAGYEAFNFRVASDHRGYFLDFDTKLFFGSTTQQLADRSNRELKSSNVQQVTAYIRRKHDLLSACNAFRRSHTLSHLGNRHRLAETLDADMLLASLTAEKDLPQFGTPAWSNELARARRRVSLLTKFLSCLRTGLVLAESIQQEAANMEPPLELPSTRQECSARLRQEKQDIKIIIKESFERRDQERNRRIAELENSAQRSGKTSAQRLRRIKKAEDIKQLFRKLKYSRTQKRREGVTRIEIPLHPQEDPKECTEWKLIDVPDEVLHHLQRRNRDHFGQAHGTPFTVPPLSDCLGFKGDGWASAQMLAGDYDSSDASEDVQLLIYHLQQVQEMADNPDRPTISDAEFQSKLAVWTESTTTSPSGLHLGHFKALIARHSFSSDAPDDELTEEFIKQRDELNLKQQELFDFHLALINYALERGYSYRRWQTIANTILFKDPDNVKLHRTRVIHIYEADFNLSLGIKWRSAMHRAEDLNLLNNGQYGSRSARNAVDPVFIEELQCEISRATRQPIVLTNYDATACYDRIIPNLGMLVSRKFGVPQSVTNANAATLENAEYRIRTELGLAESGYSHTVEKPIYGTGQGSANSPAIWCFLSSSLFDGYECGAYPAQYSSPDQHTQVSLGMIGFVDDCNGQTNQPMTASPTPVLISNLVAQAQYNSQRWSDILAASGGALELSKTSCHILEWKFAANGAPVLAPRHHEFAASLQVTDSHTKQVHSLELLSAYKAHKTLGHYKDPAGTQKEQYRQLKRKSDEITAFLWKCPLSRVEAWTFYYACYLPSVSYPLSCSALSKHQLDVIQRKAMKIIVARCGYNRNTRREILYGPLALGGASFRHLYVEQGVGQVLLFIRKWRADSTAGRLLRIAVAWFQVQVGTSTSFLDDVDTPLPHLESKWIKSLREFLHSTQMQLQLDNPGLQHHGLQRMHDFYIMDVLLQSKAFTGAEIKRLNYCRLYLRVVTVADIAHLTGKRLDLSKRDGRPSLISSSSQGTYIHQERPSDQDWKLWKKANLQWSTPDGQLLQSLGPWILPTSQQRQCHQAYWGRHSAYEHDVSIWVRVDDGYVRCDPVRDMWHFRESESVVPHSEIPDGTFPVEVWPLQPNHWKMIYCGTLLISPPETGIATFEDFVSRLPSWEAELLQLLELPHDPFTTGWMLSHGIRVVSDGSVWDDNLGAYGWALSTDRGERVAFGMGPARGATVDSFRAEAYGMLAALCFLRRLAEFTGQVDPWRGILATDSQSLLDVLLGHSSSSEESEGEVPIQKVPRKVIALATDQAEWDVVSSILTILETQSALKLQYVRGHQDRDAAYEHLPLLAQLNVDADARANNYQTLHGRQRPLALLTDTAAVHLITPQGTITSKYATAIRYQATSAPIINYIQSSNGWTEQIIRSINWKAHGTSLKRRVEQRSHYIKLVHGQLPTGRKVYRNDPIRSQCPACHQPNETWCHIVVCASPSRESWRAHTIAALTAKSVQLQTRPLLQRVLLAGISGMFANADTFALQVTDYPPEVHRLIRHQNNIGWHQVFLGRFCWEWSELQDDYYATRPRDPSKDKPTRLSGQRWQTHIINEVWDQWRHLWDLRNTELHGATTSQKAAAEARFVTRDLRDLYDGKHLLEPSVQSMLYPDISHHAGQSTRHLQNWLAIHGPLAKASIRRARERAIKGVRSIRQYFSVK